MWLMCINIWEEIPTNIKRLSYQFKNNTNEFCFTLKVTTYNCP